jgi:tripartite-type tricarboxylate transporter receptor subunit TctC
MNITRRSAAVAAGAVLLLAAAACGNDSGGGDSAGTKYPTRDITLIVPFGTGGSTDPIAREFARELGKVAGTGVTVENKPGSGGTIGVTAAMKAKPDGYTIALGTNSILGFQPVVNPSVPFAAPDSYIPIIKISYLPTVLAVPADSPLKSFDDFISYAKANPGKLRISHSGANTTNDVFLRQLQKAAGIKVTEVPFTNGGGESLTALLGGRTDAAAEYGPTLKASVQAGKVRVLGVFASEKYPLFPDAPLITTYGIDISTPPSQYIIVPKGVPSDVVDKLTQLSQKVVNSESFKQFAATNGFLEDPITGQKVADEIASFRSHFESLNA